MFNNDIISSISSIILVSLAVYLINSVMPQGNLTKPVRFALGIILSIVIFSPIINLVNTSSISVDTHYVQNHESMKKGIENQIRQIKGFNNATISIEVMDGEVVSIYILASKNDNSDAFDFEKNKIVLKAFLKVLYKIDENRIIIEVD